MLKTAAIQPHHDLAAGRPAWPRVSLPTDQIVLAEDIGGHARVGFGGMQFEGIEGDDESAFVRARLDAFADVLDRIGVPRRVARSMAHWPAFAVTMRVEQTFDQTPGPERGKPRPHERSARSTSGAASRASCPA